MSLRWYPETLAVVPSVVSVPPVGALPVDNVYVSAGGQLTYDTAATASLVGSVPPAGTSQVTNLYTIGGVLNFDLEL
jgi:hypothetical protein